jgi:hypothetical protein
MSDVMNGNANVRGIARALIPVCAGAAAYLFFLSIGDILLRDSDTLWQIKVGQWILDHGAMPYTDVHSFTRFGAPWMSSSWLSQVLYAAVHGSMDWAGPVILTSIAIATTVAVFIYLLGPNLGPVPAMLLVTLALLMSGTHFLARPHMLALPVLLAFVGGLMGAADRRSHPSWLLLPLMALWANLHGGFLLGLALIGPIGLEAVWCSDPKRRVVLAMRWALFAIAALVASCCTPYGWNTLLGATKILSLGKLLSLIWEWMPADFSSISFFEAALLGLIGIAFYRRLVLSVPRILLLLGLIWMALTHARNIEVFAFLAPLVLAKPIAEQWGTGRNASAALSENRPPLFKVVLATLAVIVAGSAFTGTFLAHHSFSFVRSQPVEAVDVLKQRRAERIFSTAPVGGYLIFRDIKAFVDGRAELYGEHFVMDYFDAIAGKDVETLLRLLETYQIDATLLSPTLPAAKLLDHVAGWKRLYADKLAVIHVREDRASRNLSSISEVVPHLE